MPSKKPSEFDSQKDWLSFCMADDSMNKEHEDRSQRAAVCHNMWRSAKGKSLLPSFDKQARFEMPLIAGELKAKVGGEPGDAGWIEGYASIFNNLDQQREIVRPGCFKQSAKERVPAGKVKLMVQHYAYGGNAIDCIGTITEGKEDAKGLWFHAELSSVLTAQEIRQKVLEGHVGYASVGYIPLEWKNIEWEDGDTAVELTKAKWLETTITNLPANEDAVLTAAKDILADSDALRSRGLSESDRSRIESVTGKLAELTSALDSLLKVKEPDAAKDVLAIYSDLEQRRDWLKQQALALGI